MSDSVGLHGVCRMRVACHAIIGHMAKGREMQGAIHFSNSIVTS